MQIWDISNEGKHNVPAHNVAYLNSLSDGKGITGILVQFLNEMENKKEKCKFT